MTVRQRDIQAVVRALRAEGLEAERVEITPGGAVVYARGAGASTPPEDDEAGRWLRDHGAQDR